MTLAVYWLFFAALVGVCAIRYRRNPLMWFIMATLFSPLVAGIILVVLGNALIPTQSASKLKLDFLSLYYANENELKHHAGLERFVNDLCTDKPGISERQIEIQIATLIDELSRSGSTPEHG